MERVRKDGKADCIMHCSLWELLGLTPDAGWSLAGGDQSGNFDVISKVRVIVMWQQLRGVWMHTPADADPQLNQRITADVLHCYEFKLRIIR